MTHTPGKNDGKLLFAIAGGILVIAAGIAVLASLGGSGEHGSQEVTAIPAVRTSSVEPVVMPASETTPVERASSLVDLVEETEAFGVDPSADFVKEGIAAYESRRYDEAAAYFAAEAQARPDRAWTHYILALSLWKSGQADQASVEMRRSVEIDGTQLKALVNLSRIENDRGEFDAARAAAEEAVAQAPGDAEASFLLARSLYNVEDKEAALAALETSIGLDPENGYVSNLTGLIWIERGEAAPAVEAMRRAAERLPEVAFVQNNLGMALELAGAVDEAAAAYARAVALAPDHTRAAMNLARLDGRVPAAPAAPGDGETADSEPVVAVLTSTDVPEETTHESEIPD
jgi:tetratricopeptide (TPR) repeat protein